MALPGHSSKDHGLTNFLLSHKLMTFIVVAITCLALYHVKISLGENLWKTSKAPPDLGGKTTMNEFILDYFKTGRDAGLITWAHAVNSKQVLDTHMKSDVMMLEGDALVDKSGTVVMAHPPDTSSDLPMTDFLKTALDSKKGVKLDFKTSQAAEAGLFKVSQLLPEMQRRIWINADILTGTKGPPCKFVADQFLSLVKEYTPNNLLSLGWTIGLPDDHYKGGYDYPMVEAMHSVLVKNKVDQPISFAVEATYTVLSVDELGWLLSQTSQSSLTVWFHKQSRATAQDLICLRERFGKEKVFLDMPPTVQKEFDALMADKRNVSKCRSSGPSV